MLSACKLLIRSLSFSGVKLSAEYRLTLLLRCSSFAYTDNRSENQSLQFGQDLLKPIVYSLSFSNHSKRLHEKMPIRNSRSRSEQSWNLCLVNLSIVVSIMDVSDCHLLRQTMVVDSESNMYSARHRNYRELRVLSRKNLGRCVTHV